MINLHKRNKISNDGNMILHNDKYKQNNTFKPTGFWYSCKNSRIDWVTTENMGQFLHKYIYKIVLYSKSFTNIHNPDKNKILLIQSLKDFDTFNDKFKYRKNEIESRFKDEINWDMVSKYYSGIEIAPLLEKRRFVSWYYSWDVASGCIWNTDLIKKIEITHIKNDSNVYELVSNTFK